MRTYRAIAEMRPPEQPQTDANGLPKGLADHKDGCTCPRCVGLEECYVCRRIKLDIDWCFSCGRLVL